jgi:hypothetical protein
VGGANFIPAYSILFFPRSMKKAGKTWWIFTPPRLKAAKIF